MRWLISGFIFCVFVMGFSCRPAAAPVSMSNRPVSINDQPTTGVVMPPSKPIGEMSWTTDDGKVHKLADLKGKAVILDFWATYCPPCKEEIPHLNSLVAKHGGDLVVVGLNVGGEEDKPAIPKFVAETRLDYPIAWPENELSRFIFSDRDDIPQTLVIGRNGDIVTKIVGFSPRIQQQLDAAVDEALKN